MPETKGEFWDMMLEIDLLTSCMTCQSVIKVAQTFVKARCYRAHRECLMVVTYPTAGIPVYRQEFILNTEHLAEYPFITSLYLLMFGLWFDCIC